ncbi:MAG: hypothetical protein Q8R60_01255 [Mycobacteriales bacterium]|nr:hypothetical protein [Mycobacteriales bacterium]
MKLTRPALALAAVAALAVGLVPAQAAQGPVVLTDVAGDANGVNGQGLVDGGPNNMATAPASMASMDIVSVTLTNTGTTRKVKQGKKVVSVFDCTGFTATLELGAAPFQSAIYRVTGTAPVNVGTWWLTFTNDATGALGQVQYSADGADPLAGGVVDVPVKVEGSKVTWTVSKGVIKTTGEKLGFDWSGIGAHSRVIAGVATVPLIDDTPAETFFKPCG